MKRRLNPNIVQGLDIRKARQASHIVSSSSHERARERPRWPFLLPPDIKPSPLTIETHESRETANNTSRLELPHDI